MSIEMQISAILQCQIVYRSAICPNSIFSGDVFCRSAIVNLHTTDILESKSGNRTAWFIVISNIQITFGDDSVNSRSSFENSHFSPADHSLFGCAAIGDDHDAAVGDRRIGGDSAGSHFHKCITAQSHARQCHSRTHRGAAGRNPDGIKPDVGNIPDLFPCRFGECTFSGK